MKILIVLSNLRENNGVANCMMNYYDGLLDNSCKVDFLCLNDVKSSFIDKIFSNNKSNYYVLPDQNMKLTNNNISFINNIFISKKYDIVHVNIIGKIAYYILKKSKKYNVPTRILHSHNPKEKNTIKNCIRTFLYTEITNFYANRYIACTELAGKSIFGRRKFDVLKNAISIEKYSYNEEYRDYYKKEFGIDDEFIIGTSCRHAKQKNPFFIIDIFAEYKKTHGNTKLLWAGTGPLTENLKIYSKKKNIDDAILFIGNRNDMNKIYSVMDVFLLPSLYEGLGMVFIEAQANGLYCFASNNVYHDTNVTGNIKYIDLKKSAKEWANIIKNTELPKREISYYESISNKGYCIRRERKKMYLLYKKYSYLD